MTFNDFEGHWQLSRHIEDFRAATTARLEGQVVFERRDAVTLVQRETGHLILPDGARFEAERSYIWRKSGDEIAVYFDETRFFHAFDPAAPAPSAHHDCPPDDYRVTYDLAAGQASPDTWESVWRVRGPRKDYRSTSRFSRS